MSTITNITIQKQVSDICNLLNEKKAQDIIAIDIADKSIIADYIIVCSGRSNVQVKAFSDEIEMFGKDNGLDLRRIEGYNAGRWIVLDYADILVHVFHPDEREYYDVERLWKDDNNFVEYGQDN